MKTFNEVLEQTSKGQPLSMEVDMTIKKVNSLSPEAQSQLRNPEIAQKLWKEIQKDIVIAQQAANQALDDTAPGTGS